MNPNRAVPPLKASLVISLSRAACPIRQGALTAAPGAVKGYLYLFHRYIRRLHFLQTKLLASISTLPAVFSAITLEGNTG